VDLEILQREGGVEVKIGLNKNKQKPMKMNHVSPQKLTLVPDPSHRLFPGRRGLTSMIIVM